MPVRPETRYAKSGDVSIAYQVVGDGPFDLVFAPGSVSNLEFGWEEPTLERFYQRLASFCRLIIFDKRGTGVSDRVSGVPDLETRMDDVRAIMDAVGSERAAVLGYSEGAAMAALFAATYPERTPALALGEMLGVVGRLNRLERREQRCAGALVDPLDADRHRQRSSPGRRIFLTSRAGSHPDAARVSRRARRSP